MIPNNDVHLNNVGVTTAEKTYADLVADFKACGMSSLNEPMRPYTQSEESYIDPRSRESQIDL